MSSQVGSLERPRSSNLGPAIGIALLVAVAIVVVATSIGGDTTSSSDLGRRSSVGSANNTPTEMRAAFGTVPAIVTGTLANTPAELRGGLFEATETTEAVVPAATFGRRAVTPRVGSSSDPSSPDGSSTVGGDTGATHHPLP